MTTVQYPAQHYMLHKWRECRRCRVEFRSYAQYAWLCDDCTAPPLPRGQLPLFPLAR